MNAARTLANQPISWEAILRAQGLRVTRSTRELITVLRAQPDLALSHAELHAHARLADVDRVTLYRMLDRLHSAGLAERHVSDDGLARFRWKSQAAPSKSPQTSADTSAWFDCTQCHSSQRIEEDERVVEAVKALRKTIKTISASQVAASLRLSGVCKKCDA
jgi:Fur family transcriptional regulator, ferric uptake regulator